MILKRNLSRKTIFAFFGGCVILSILFIMLIITIKTTITKDSTRMISTSATHATNSTRLLMENNIKVLESIAEYAGKTPHISQSDVLHLYETCLQTTQLSSLDVLYSNGDRFSADGKKYAAREDEFIKQAFKGSTTISPVQFDLVNSEEFMVIATPFYASDTVDGVVYSKLKCRDFLLQFNKFNSDTSCRYFLIDDQMNNMLKSTDKEPKQIFDMISSKNLESINNTEENNNQVFTANDNLIIFSKLGIDDLTLMTVMDKSAVLLNSKQVLQLALALMVIFLVISIITIFFIIVFFKRSRQRLKLTGLEFETVMSNIPGGVVRFNYDNGFSIKFLNEGLLGLTGYTINDLNTTLNNKFINFLHWDDRKKITQAVNTQAKTQQPISMDCRIIKKDGTFAWFLIKGKIISHKDNELSCLCVLTDISTMKAAENQLNQTMQRYSVVIEQSDSIIFEYSFIDKTLYVSDKWHSKFDFATACPDFLKSAADKNFIHKDDVDKFMQVLNSIKNGESYASADIRLESKLSGYIWCTLKASAIFDENGKVYKTVGKISDVNKQYCEKEQLKKRAELDSLTEIYNKGATQMLIDNFLENDQSGLTHALLILDIDNFKLVNDGLGHLVGDSVIIDITARVKGQLRSGDIFGRIGGDEFAILLKNVGNIENVKKKARELCTTLRHTVCGEGPDVNISGSMGIIMLKGNSITYRQAVDLADNALYIAKDNGKDNFVICEQ